MDRDIQTYWFLLLLLFIYLFIYFRHIVLNKERWKEGWLEYKLTRSHSFFPSRKEDALKGNQPNFSTGNCKRKRRGICRFKDKIYLKYLNHDSTKLSKTQCLCDNKKLWVLPSITWYSYFVHVNDIMAIILRKKDF